MSSVDEQKTTCCMAEEGRFGLESYPGTLLHIFFISLTLLSSVSIFTASLSKKGKNKQTNKKPENNNKKVFELS